MPDHGAVDNPAPAPRLDHAPRPPLASPRRACYQDGPVIQERTNGFVHKRNAKQNPKHHPRRNPKHNLMPPGLGFALGAMLGFAASDIVYKRGAAAGVRAGEFVVLQAWCFCPAVTVYALLTGTLDLHPAALWGSLAGLFLLVAMYNFARSLQDGAVSTNASIFRLNFTLTAALAILFLGETLTLAKAIALACALGAVWLLLGDGGDPGTASRQAR